MYIENVSLSLYTQHIKVRPANSTEKLCAILGILLPASWILWLGAFCEIWQLGDSVWMENHRGRHAQGQTHTGVWPCASSHGLECYPSTSAHNYYPSGCCPDVTPTPKKGFSKPPPLLHCISLLIFILAVVTERLPITACVLGGLLVSPTSMSAPQ